MLKAFQRRDTSLEPTESADRPPDEAIEPALSPRAVYALVGANVALFALETLWGGSESAPTLYRMGANLGRASLREEPWRILSSAFLHIGPTHLLLNMWALFSFGGLLERLLGSARLVAVYAVAAAGGGVASALSHAQALAAGASGAVWGLMAGEIVLLLRARRRFGAEAVPVNTGALAMPLVINFAYSFAPGIDLFAHLGGGAAGAILVGLLPLPLPPAERAWRTAAALGGVLMAASVGLAISHGRPWELAGRPTLVNRAVPGTAVAVPIPVGLESMVQPRTAEASVVLFGNLRHDPLMVECRAGRWMAPDSADRDSLGDLARELGAEPRETGLTREQAPRVIDLPRGKAVAQVLKHERGLRVHDWLIVADGWFVRLQVVLRLDAPEGWRALPEAIARGVEIGREAATDAGKPP